VEFQNIVSHVQDLKEKYFSRLQIENSNSIIEKLGGGSIANAPVPGVKTEDLEKYKKLMQEISGISSAIKENYAAIHNIIEKTNSMPQISREKIDELKSLANSIAQASAALSNEHTVTGLKYLESIVKK